MITHGVDDGRTRTARSGENVRLDDAEAETWRTLAAVLVRLPAALDAQLQRDAGLSFFEYQVLAALAEVPDRALRLGDLARAVSSSPSRLSRGMTRLEAKGCVERTVDPVEKRYTLGRLTDRGCETVRAAAPAHEAAVRRWVFDGLSDAEAQQLRQVGLAVRDALPGADHPDG